MCKNANTEILLKCITQDDGVKLLEIYMLGPVVTIWPLGHWSERLSEQFLLAIRSGQHREAGSTF